MPSSFPCEASSEQIAGQMRPLYAHESYVFHVTLEVLQELQIHMVMFEALGDLDTAVGSGGTRYRSHLT